MRRAAHSNNYAQVTRERTTLPPDILPGERGRTLRLPLPLKHFPTRLQESIARRLVLELGDGTPDGVKDVPVQVLEWSLDGA
jgi:hypothetical protein